MSGTIFNRLLERAVNRIFGVFGANFKACKTLLIQPWTWADKGVLRICFRIIQN